MRIQEIIGQRLSSSRKKRGMTQKALAELSEGSFTASSIANWESASRTPGPTEALLLGKLLNVAPSYLLGLSDDEDGNILLREPEFKAVPLLNSDQARDPIHTIITLRKHHPESIQYAPLCAELQNQAHQFCFAFEVADDGMLPTLRPGDVVIIDPEQKPKPGNLVAAVVGSQGLVIRQYKQRGFNQSFEAFELTALNSNWANIIVETAETAKIIGVVCQSTHVYL